MKRAKKQVRRQSPKTYPREGNATAAEAAEFLNCGRTTVYKMVREGALWTVPVGSDKRIPWPVLWEYVSKPAGMVNG